MKEGTDQEGINKERKILVQVMFVVFLVTYLKYLHDYSGWLKGLEQFIGWLLSPSIHYTPLFIHSIYFVLVGITEILLLGTLLTHLLIPEEGDLCIRWLSALAVGIGLVAFITMILGVLQCLCIPVLNATIIILIAALFLIDLLRWRKKWLSHFASYWKISATCIKNNPLLFIAFTPILILIFYHALFSPIDHFDALIYHAGMAKIMFKYGGIPVIAGPSPGIEMSANYPPLYSSLGAFFFIQMGTTLEDLPLRAISPFMGLLSIFATYKLSFLIFGKKDAALAAFTLIVSPLFIIYSIHALNYMFASCYLLLAVLFITIFFYSKRWQYLFCSGLFYGFALSTTYHSLYFIPPFILSLIFYLKNERIRYLASFLSGVTLTGAIWYIRNLIILHNPVWPFAYQFLDGAFIDQVMITRSFRSIHEVGTYVSFGREPNILDFFNFTFFGRVGFPALSFLAILGTIYAVSFDSIRKSFIFVSFTFIPLILLISSPYFFPRYLVLVLPYFAALSGHALSYIFRFSHQKMIKILTIFILVLVLIYPGITVAASGKMYHDVAPWKPPQDFLWYLRNPGVDFLTDMKRGEGERVEVWSWLNNNLKPGERVATYESRIYYIKEGDLRYFFFLDGWEARPLFAMSNPDQMITFLKAENVSYILVLGIVSVGIDTLPLIQFLGTPYFPLIYQKSDAKVYQVGPISEPILIGQIPSQINYEGWSDPKIIRGKLCRAVLANNDRPRLLISTPNWVIVKITYLDKGNGSLGINFYNRYTCEWLCHFAEIKKQNTNEWRSFEFVVPPDFSRKFVEFGLHAYDEDFLIHKIEVFEFKGCSGKYTLTDLKGEITNSTMPPTLMMYLPILTDNENIITVKVDSHGKNVSIEIFEGIIHPWENTTWWERHKMVARVPKLPVWGEINPTLCLNTKAGIYTLVIVLWDEYEPGDGVGLLITVGGGNEETT